MGVALPAFWIVSMPSARTAVPVVALATQWRVSLVVALVGAVLLMLTATVIPTAVIWVGVGYCMLVLWGHALWLTLRLGSR